MDPIIRQLKASKSILVSTHTNPDGDAVGSMLAMGLALESLNKHTILYNESPIPAVYRYLPYVRQITRHLEVPGSFDTAIILDCGSLERCGSAASAMEKIPVVINLDHHSTNSHFGDYHVVDPSACATAEIVYRVIKTLGVTITKTMAIALYTGILTDTGSFRFSNTNQAAFDICREMVKAGVEPYDVAQQVYGTYSLGRIKLLNHALDSIEISENGKLSIMTLTRRMMAETGTQSEDIDGMIHYARRIEDVRVAALIQELKNEGRYNGDAKNYHVSLRSDGEIDVAAFASSFGGGGHATAAGFNIESTLPALKSKIRDLADRCDGKETRGRWRTRQSG